MYYERDPETGELYFPYSGEEETYCPRTKVVSESFVELVVKRNEAREKLEEALGMGMLGFEEVLNAR